MIANLLSYGPQNGLHLSDLVRLTDRTGRDVRREIQFERLQGVPILSNNVDGYFLPETEEERASCVRSLRNQAREIMATAEALDRAEV